MKYLFIFIVFSFLCTFSLESQEIKGRSRSGSLYDPQSKSFSETYEKKISVLPKIWSVVVGLSDHRESSLNLNYAYRDAQSFYDFLRSPKGGSISSDRGALLINEEATKSNIFLELETKFLGASTEDIIIFYFVGHILPAQDEKENYFLSYDTKISDLAGSSVLQSEIEKIVLQSRAMRIVFILDAIHNNTFQSDESWNYPSKTYRILQKLTSLKGGVVLLTSSSKNDASQEGKRWGAGHGIFTYYLVKGLEGEANRNFDEVITLDELFDYASKKIYDDTDNKQRPELRGSLTNRIPLSITK